MKIMLFYFIYELAVLTFRKRSVTKHTYNVSFYAGFSNTAVIFLLTTGNIPPIC
jgi:hypothetical protein